MAEYQFGRFELATHDIQTILADDQVVPSFLESADRSVMSLLEILAYSSVVLQAASSLFCCLNISAIRLRTRNRSVGSARDHWPEVNTFRASVIADLTVSGDAQSMDSKSSSVAGLYTGTAPTDDSGTICLPFE